MSIKTQPLSTPKYGENFAVAFKEEIRQKEEFRLDMDSWLNQTMGGERWRETREETESKDQETSVAKVGELCRDRAWGWEAAASTKAEEV